MFKKFIHFFLKSIKAYHSIINFLVVPFLDVRDFIFVVLVKRIHFRKDVAEFLISEIELNKSSNVMDGSENSRRYYRYRNSNNNRIGKVNCHD